MDLSKPGRQQKETQIRKKIQRRLSSSQFLQDLISWELRLENDRWHLQLDFNYAAFQKLLTHRLGRTVLLTNRMDWTAEQVVNGYSGQQQVEQVFRGLKDGNWLGWGPMYHWTDSKIRIHAFDCRTHRCPNVNRKELQRETLAPFSFVSYPPSPKEVLQCLGVDLAFEA